MKKFYITTTLPYVNADPHIGFALEVIQADVIARYKTLQGFEIFFNTGTDEHGTKIYEKAKESKLPPEKYCDEYAERFKKLKEKLNLTYNNFIRTTDDHHIKAVQKFWKKCQENGDIYKRNYKAKYCVGCEMEKTDSELENGRCPLHPNRKLEIIEEENYFFRFSKYQKPLLDFYKKHPDFVIPKHRYNEVIKFVEKGLKDFSASRLKEKMPWGIEVPDDPDHVMYVWFDALINYISCLGWPDNKKKFNNFWPGVQVAGKDNLRQQAAMWQAMLLSAGLPHSKQIFIHGFITADGQKMSKSVGNVINASDLVKKYGTDATRYFLLREIPDYEDGDFTYKRFEERYNSDLANDLGNLLNRTLTMIEKYCDGKIPKSTKDSEFSKQCEETWKKIDELMKVYKFSQILEEVFRLLSKANQYIDEKKPWELAKENEKEELEKVLYNLAETLRQFGIMLYPFIPNTSDKTREQLGLSEIDIKDFDFEKEKNWGELKSGIEIKKGKTLFPRLGNQ
ncbi:methionine--tRNA ligase [bacterium (Candidatus Torokbacteria) CG_4_10_14_0_2_um_filter_35_8]|nr:MAG: methionine--tRNA ligase [bacterium (Candidatus Torokbacteria) CG_4_10_14_0_2_um_filter_35_8]